MIHTRTIAIAGAPLLLLLIPLVGNFPWQAFDYVVGAVLLFTLGVGLAVSTALDARYRTLAVVILLVAFCLVWAELAVGLFGTPLAGS